jgi:hypothetical protein
MKGVQQMNNIRINIPSITSIDTALKTYYEYSELGNAEITALFGKRSSATVAKLKLIVKDEMNKKGVYSYGANKINTKIAYSVWGINVSDLEKRMKKLKELNL